jgi:hypothetical protein
MSSAACSGARLGRVSVPIEILRLVRLLANPYAHEGGVPVKKELFKMKIWKRGRVVTSALATLAFLVSTSCTSGKAQDQRVADLRSGTLVRNPSGKLVFMLTTGFEDLLEVRLCLRDIKAAKTSGYVEDVVWLVRGRGVDALGKPQGVLTRPADIVRLAREVKAAGVRIIASTDALKEQQISVVTLDPQPTDLVDDSATVMSELVSKSYQVIRY